MPSDTGASGPIGSVSDDIWTRRVVGAVDPGSRRACKSGCHAFNNKFCTLHHIHSLFQLDSVDQDILVLVAFIDYLFKHMQPGSIQGYVSGVKNYFMSSTVPLSPALGGHGYFHPLVSMALHSLSHSTATVPPLPGRLGFTDDMLRRGQQLWPPAIYAIVVIISRAFLLRTGEILPKHRKFGPHALR